MVRTVSCCRRCRRGTGTTVARGTADELKDLNGGLDMAYAVALDRSVDAAIMETKSPRCTSFGRRNSGGERLRLHG